MPQFDYLKFVWPRSVLVIPTVPSEESEIPSIRGEEKNNGEPLN